MIKIKFPNRIKSDLNGYLFLVKEYRKIKDVKAEEIHFDYSNTKWFDANMLALLGAMVENLYSKDNKVTITNLIPKLENLFCRNHFLCFFGKQSLPDQYNSTVKYKRFDTSDIFSFDEYLENDLFSKGDFPKISKLLRKKIRESSIEIFDNAVCHGECNNVFTCGQYYRGIYNRRLDFTIVDVGKSIRKNVRDFRGDPIIKGNEAIKWAVERGNTTKTGTIPGGLGFSLIREFLQKNGGKIQILSADGFWEERGQNVNSEKMDGFFQGTIVNLEFNLNDKSYYYLKSEITNGEIPF